MLKKIFFSFFIILALFLVACTRSPDASCDSEIAALQRDLAELNTCTTANDCAALNLGEPLSTVAELNKEKISPIIKRIESLEKTCQRTITFRPVEGKFLCTENRCVLADTKSGDGKKDDGNGGTQPGGKPRKPSSGTGTPACKFPQFTLDSRSPLRATKPVSPGRTDTIIDNMGDPWIFYDYEEKLFKMWHTHWIPDKSHPRGGRLGFAYATSTDGFVWDYYTGKENNVIHVFDTTPNAWDYYGTETNTVVKTADGKYHMWYYGYPGVDTQGRVLNIKQGRRDHIGYATSDDGITWKKYANNPALAPTFSWEQPYSTSTHEGGTLTPVFQGGLLEPSVLWDGAQFRMWYEASAQGKSPNGDRTFQLWRIGYATSTDGITWQKESDPVLERPTDPESWDFPPYGIGIPSVTQDPIQGCHMVYTAGGKKTTIGHAYSANCKDNWEKDPNNPLIPQPKGETPATNLYGQAHILWHNGKLYIYTLRTKANSACPFCGGQFDVYVADCPAP